MNCRDLSLRLFRKGRVEALGCRVLQNALEGVNTLHLRAGNVLFHINMVMEEKVTHRGCVKTGVA